MAGKTQNYTEDFKKQIVALKKNGKSTADISRDRAIASLYCNKLKFNHILVV